MAGVNKQTFIAGMAIVGGAALLLGALFGGVVGYRVGKPATTSVETTPAGKQIYTRNEFRGAVIGKRQEQVLAAVGKPDRTKEDTGAGVEWIYYDTCRDPLTGKIDPFTYVRFFNGIVVDVR